MRWPWPSDVFAAWRGPLPCAVRLCVLCALAWAWAAHGGERERAISVLGASAYVLVESAWTTARLSLLHGRWHGGHTTWVQFWCNVLYVRVLLLAYRGALQSAALRVLLFPLNIWLLEVVQGYFITWVFGRNVAWTYQGCPDALFDGNIRLNYAPAWVALGAAVELLWEPVLEPAVEALAASSRYYVVLAAALPLTFLSDALCGWPRLALDRPQAKAE